MVSRERLKQFVLLHDDKTQTVGKASFFIGTSAIEVPAALPKCGINMHDFCYTERHRLVNQLDSSLGQLALADLAQAIGKFSQHGVGG